MVQAVHVCFHSLVLYCPYMGIEGVGTSRNRCKMAALKIILLDRQSQIAVNV
jgi:hypothetical protein